MKQKLLEQMESWSGLFRSRWSLLFQAQPLQINFGLALFTSLLVILLSSVASAQELKSPVNVGVRPAPDRSAVRTVALKTPWGREVSPADVHPDYPRPTLVRGEWLNLNGLWDWKNSELATERPPDAYDGKILVPFPVESSLSGVGKPVERLVYRRHFTIPKHWPVGHRIILHFGAVDWEANVLVNGRPVGRHQGGYDPFSFDITDFLAPRDSVQELVVHVFDPTNRGQQPRGKQSFSPSGIWYTSSTGIWQTVWLEPVAPYYLKSLRFFPDTDSGVLTILPQANAMKSDLSIFAEVFDGEEIVAKTYGGVDGPLLLRLPKNNLKLWSPDQPYLYQIRIRLLERETPIDQIGSYTAFRKIELTNNALGQPRIRLNGRFLFQVGVLDQGYWPDGLYTAPSEQALRADILTAKKLGFNMIRKHVKIEPERWYYNCDRIGMLVWQDIPNGDNRTPEARSQFRQEWERMVLARLNHPSIVVWTLFNEGWGQHDTPEYVERLRRIDPTRLIDAAGGWTDFGVGDLNDHHKFPGPESPRPDSSRASVIGSFGGLTLVPSSEHLWTTETWGYQHVADSDALLKTYRAMHEQLRRMIREEGLSGAVFHQLTDVEGECNGLVAYDRAVLKIPPDDLEQINRATIDYGSETPPPDGE